MSKPESFKISVILYKNGEFVIILKNEEEIVEVELNGKKPLSTYTEKEIEFLNRIAPPCVWTSYEEVIEE